MEATAHKPAGKALAVLACILFVGCLALAFIIAHACWRIETLNAKAGYLLPRKDYSESGNNKWRQSPFTTEERWLRSHRIAPDGSVDRSPLLPAEKVRMEEAIKYAKANNELRGMVGTVGLRQYPLCLLGICAAVYLVVRKKTWYWRLNASLLLGSATVGLGFALQREYLRSLGW